MPDLPLSSSSVQAPHKREHAPSPGDLDFGEATIHPELSSLTDLPPYFVEQIAAHLAAEDRQQLRLASSRLRHSLTTSAHCDTLSMKIDQVITPSSLAAMGEALLALPPAQRAPLLVRLAARLQQFPVILRYGYTVMLNVLLRLPPAETLAPLAAMAEAWQRRSKLGSAAYGTNDLNADTPARLIRFVEGHLPPALRMEAFIALAQHNIWAEDLATNPQALPVDSPRWRSRQIARSMGSIAFRVVSTEAGRRQWNEWLRETLTLPEQDRNEALSALASTRRLYAWPELFEAAKTLCAENKATIYLGIASMLRVFLGSGDITYPVRRLTDAMQGLALGLRMPILIHIATALAENCGRPDWHAFLQHVNETVPPQRRLPILLAMVYWPIGKTDTEFLNVVIDATRELPPDHRDAVLAHCVHTMSEPQQADAIEMAYRFARNIAPREHRHRLASALAAKRRWVLGCHGDGEAIPDVLRLVHGLDSQHRWPVLGWLMYSIFGSAKSCDEWMDEPCKTMRATARASLEAKVAALPAVHRARLLKMIVGRIAVVGSPAWRWALKSVMSLPPSDRCELLVALTQTQGDPHGRIPWEAAMQMLNAASQVPRALRAAATAGADTMLSRALDVTIGHYYGTFRFKRLWNTLPAADKYPTTRSYW